MSLHDREANRDAELVARDDPLEPMTDEELAASCPECVWLYVEPVDVWGDDELPPYDEFGERSDEISDAGDREFGRAA